MELTEKQIASELIYDGKIITLYRDDVLLPNGKTGVRECIRHVGAVCVAPVTDDGRVVLERQFRYPFGSVLTEIPAGKLDGKEEDPESAARRELREETGAQAEEMIFLGDYYPTCAYSDEVIHMYLARGITFGERSLDEDEFLNVQLVSLEEAVADVLNGTIKDGKTQTTLLKAYLWLKENRR
ncbi:MAG: NUDIX hydrolase [Clostridia bacterium]|nr:NUDIX hydrolase [Clostridia bacterium]